LRGLDGQVLFLTSSSGLVDLDCMLDAAASSVSTPVHVSWTRPHITPLETWQLGLVESWLDEGKTVWVTFESRPTGPKARFTCQYTTVLVDTPELAESA
jgi:hypothetical protein